MEAKKEEKIIKDIIWLRLFNYLGIRQLNGSYLKINNWEISQNKKSFEISADYVYGIQDSGEKWECEDSFKGVLVTKIDIKRMNKEKNGMENNKSGKRSSTQINK